MNEKSKQPYSPINSTCTPGMWSAYFGELSPEDMVRTFAIAGWQNLELSTEHGEALLDQGDPAKVGKQFREFALEHNVRFPQGHLWLQADIVSDGERGDFDTLRRWLDLFIAVGVKAGVLHPGGRLDAQAGVPADEIFERRTQKLRKLCDHLAGSDFVICLENGGSANKTIDELNAMLDAADRPDHLGICLDTGHLNLNSGDQADFIRKAGSRLKALHIADNEGKTDQHLMPFGRGTVPWDVVTREINAIGYDGLFNFEIPGENRCPIPVRLKKLDYLKSILPVLMGLDASS